MEGSRIKDRKTIMTGERSRLVFGENWYYKTKSKNSRYFPNGRSDRKIIYIIGPAPIK